MSLLTVWRIVQEDYLESAFSGIGAELYGGRFNSPGRRVVYTSGSLSLAILEMLVQANARHRLHKHWCIPATFEANMVLHSEAASWPEGWDAIPYGRTSQELGDRWLEDASSVALAVSSVVVSIESNYLINPLHADFERIVIGEPLPLPFDQRLTDQATAATGTPRTRRSRR